MFLRIFYKWRSSYTGIPSTIWFLSLVSLINRCGGMVIAFISVYMTQHLHFSIKEAGYVMGCFGGGALIGAFIGGRLTDRFGHHAMQITSLLLNGIMLLLLMTVTQFWWMCATVFVLSLVSEIFRPANSVAIARHATPDTRTRSISLYRMAINLGWAIAPALGGLLAAIGWNWLFWVDGITCLLAALLLHLLLPPVAASQTLEKEEHLESKSVSPYKDRPYLAFCVLSFLNALVFMQLLWTVPVFFKDGYHWNEALIGVVAAVNGLVVFLVEMPLIYRIDGRRKPTYFIRWGLVMYGLAYSSFLLHVSNTMIPALMYMVAISIGEILVMPFSTNFAFGRAHAEGSQGAYMALYSMAYSMANIVAPLMGTQIIAGLGYDALWIALALLAIVSLLGFMWLERRLDRHSAQTELQAAAV